MILEIESHEDIEWDGKKKLCMMSFIVHSIFIIAQKVAHEDINFNKRHQA